MKNFCSLKNIGKKLKRHAAEWEEIHPSRDPTQGLGQTVYVWLASITRKRKPN